MSIEHFDYDDIDHSLSVRRAECEDSFYRYRGYSDADYEADAADRRRRRDREEREFGSKAPNQTMSGPKDFVRSSNDSRDICRTENYRSQDYIDSLNAEKELHRQEQENNERREEEQRRREEEQRRRDEERRRGEEEQRRRDDEQRRQDNTPMPNPRGETTPIPHPDGDSSRNDRRETNLDPNRYESGDTNKYTSKRNPEYTVSRLDYREGVRQEYAQVGKEARKEARETYRLGTQVATDIIHEFDNASHSRVYVDPVREVRETLSGGTVATLSTAALLVASAASSLAFESRTRKVVDEWNTMHRDEETFLGKIDKFTSTNDSYSAKNSRDAKESVTLAEHAAEARRKENDAMRNAFNVINANEYDQERAKHIKTISEARMNCENKSAELNKQAIAARSKLDEATRKYEAAVQSDSFKTEMASHKQNYDNEVKSAHNIYQSDLARINEKVTRDVQEGRMTASEGEAFRAQKEAAAASKRDESIQRANTTYTERQQTTLSRAGADSAAAYREYTSATQTYNRKIEDIKSQKAGLEAERDAVVRSAETKIAEAKTLFEKQRDDINNYHQEQGKVSNDVLTANKAAAKIQTSSDTTQVHHSDSAGAVKTHIVNNLAIIANYTVDICGNEKKKAIVGAHRQAQDAELKRNDRITEIGNILNNGRAIKDENGNEVKDSHGKVKYEKVKGAERDALKAEQRELMSKRSDLGTDAVAKSNKILGGYGASDLKSQAEVSMTISNLKRSIGIQQGHLQQVQGVVKENNEKIAAARTQLETINNRLLELGKNPKANANEINKLKNQALGLKSSLNSLEQTQAKAQKELARAKGVLAMSQDTVKILHKSGNVIASVDTQKAHKNTHFATFKATWKAGKEAKANGRSVMGVVGSALTASVGSMKSQRAIKKEMRAARKEARKKRDNSFINRNLNKNIRRSILSIQKTISKYATQGNVMLAGNRAATGKLEEVAKYIDTSAKAAAISLVATKMILKVVGAPIGMAFLKSKIFQNASGKPLAKVTSLFKKIGKNPIIKKTGKFVGGVLKAPGAAIMMLDPEKLMKKLETLPFELAAKGAKVTAKVAIRGGARATVLVAKPTIKLTKKTGVVVGRALGKGARLVGKGLGKTAAGKAAKKVGSAMSKLWEKAVKKSFIGKSIASVGAVFGKVGKALSPVTSWLGRGAKKLGLGLLKFVKDPIGSIIGIVMGLISSLISGVLSLLINLFVTILLALMPFIAVFLIVIILIFSILLAISGFFDDALSSTWMPVNKEPSYLAALGSNYRNTEMAILEYFMSEDGGRCTGADNDVYSEGEKVYSAGAARKIEANNDPIYYAIFDTTFHWFGKYEAGKDINFIYPNPDSDVGRERVYNKDAKALYERLLNKDDPNSLYNAPNVVPGSVTTKQSLKEIIFDAFKRLVGLISSIFKGLMSLAEQEANAAVAGTFKDILHTEEEIENSHFGSVVIAYDNVSLAYHPGRFEEKQPASEYEVSNAKDVLAMVDAMYMEDDELTRYEALRYLGAGEHQLTKFETDKPIGNKQDKKVKLDKSNDVDNLFWKSHVVTYGNPYASEENQDYGGTRGTDIYFHETNYHGSMTDDNAFYVANGCQNQGTRKIKYKIQVVTQESKSGTKRNQISGDKNIIKYMCIGNPSCNGKCTTTVLDTDWRLYNYGSYWKGWYQDRETGKFHSFRISDTELKALCFPNGEKNINISKVTVRQDSSWYTYVFKAEASWTSETVTTEKRELIFPYCQGHADLDAHMWVTLFEAEDGSEPLYDDAATLMASEETNVGWLFFTWSDDLDIHGLGTVDVPALNPAEKWEEGSSLRGLAKAKTQDEIIYTVEDDSTWNKLTTTHGLKPDAEGFLIPVRLLTKSTNPKTADDLLYTLYYNGTPIYLRDLKSGPQKDVIAQNTASSEEIRIGFKRAATGSYYARVG